MKNIKMTKKILFICGASYVSGAEIVLLFKIEVLKKAGFQIHCTVNGWNNGDFINRLSAMDIGYTEIKLGWLYIKKPLWTLDTLVHLPSGYLKYKRLLTKFNPDLIYLNSYRYIYLLKGIINKKIIYNVQDVISTDHQAKYILQRVDDKVDKYIACSGYIKNDIESIGIKPNKIDVLYNTSTLNANNSRKFTMKDNNINISINGQILYKKGHDLAIKALGAFI